MRTVTCTEFRKNASEYLSIVEHGETLIVLRHGRAIAEISPLMAQVREEPSWKGPRLRLKGKGKGLSGVIQRDRG